MKYFFIGDTHDGHSKILDIRPFKTIEEQREILIKNWNYIVRDDDIVFHMGDIAFESRSKQREFLSQLRGHKILIKGNHDNLPDSFYLQYFEEVHNWYVLNNTDEMIAILTHIPLPYKKLLELERIFYKPVINIHAHTHNTKNPDLCGDSLAHPDYYVLTSVEAIHYAPIEISIKV